MENPTAAQQKSNTHVSEKAEARHLDVLLALLIPALIILHIIVAPFTKVEESFNLQATHDILAYGVPLRNTSSALAAHYDHVSFPGSVPRTFVGPLLLAGASWPFANIVQLIHRQILVRAILGIFNAFCILAYRNSICKVFGRNVARWFILFQACQFHIMFYASRTLPNFFAFGLCTLALGRLLPVQPKDHTVATKQMVVRRYQQGLVLLTVLGIIFRSEIAILITTNSLWLLFRGRLNLYQIISAGLLGLAAGLFITVSIDSFFWQEFPLWPELSGFIFNVMHGKSSEWGISPFIYYFSSSLPKLLFNPVTWTICIPAAIGHEGIRRQCFDVLVPALTFVVIYSFQPHKEWRFIIYALPSITTAAALGAAHIWLNRSKKRYSVSSSLLLFSLPMSIIAGVAFLVISSLNYPGGQALSQLHAMADGTQKVINVHMDVLSCMTGVTRFLQIDHHVLGLDPKGRTTWNYDKTEDIDVLLHPEFWTLFDYVLAENPEKAIGAWEVVDVVNSYVGIELVRPGQNSRDTGSSQAVGHAGDVTSFDIGYNLLELWNKIGSYGRRFTLDRWITIKMEPKINILRRTRGAV